MDTGEKTVRIYLTSSGGSPFEEWFDALFDSRAQERILARIARVRSGNLGDWKSVGAGVHEMRIDFGPGYRLYFGLEKDKIDPVRRRRQTDAGQGHQESEGILV